MNCLARGYLFGHEELQLLLLSLHLFNCKLEVVNYLQKLQLNSWISLEEVGATHVIYLIKKTGGTVAVDPSFDVLQECFLLELARARADQRKQALLAGERRLRNKVVDHRQMALFQCFKGDVVVS